MFVKAKKILASELMYAKDMDEEEAAEWLDGVLVGGASNGTANGRKKTPAKPARVAAKNSAKPATRKTAAQPKTAAKAKPKTKARASSR
jgi:hypothetical protein